MKRANKDRHVDIDLLGSLATPQAAVETHPEGYMYQCQFSEILWSPYAHKRECIDIGIMLICEEIAFAKVKFAARNALQRFRPAIDLELIRAFEEDFASKIADPGSRSVFLAKVTDWASNMLQFSAFTAVLTPDPEAHFNRLIREYLTMSPVQLSQPEPNKSQHTPLRRRMVAEFKKYEVWNHMVKQISTREYLPNSRVKIDCGYLTGTYSENRQFKMFHALDIEQDRNQVSQFVESFPDFRQALVERMNAQPTLTVIGRDWKDLAGEIETAPFDALHRAGIETRTLSDVTMLAMRAREDLGMRPM
jgi:hypothetical protein